MVALRKRVSATHPVSSDPIPLRRKPRPRPIPLPAPRPGDLPPAAVGTEPAALQQQLGAAYNTYQLQLRRFTYHRYAACEFRQLRTNAWEEAADTVQALFAHLWAWMCEKGGRLPTEPGALRAYLYRACELDCVDRLRRLAMARRRLGRQVAYALNDDDDVRDSSFGAFDVASLAAPDLRLPDGAEDQERFSPRLATVLGRMRPNLRDTLLAVYVDNDTVNTYGQLLAYCAAHPEAKYTTIKRRTDSARDAFRRGWQQEIEARDDDRAQAQWDREWERTHPAPARPAWEDSGSSVVDALGL